MASSGSPPFGSNVSVPPHKLTMQVPQSPIHHATLAVVAERPSASASARTGYGSAVGSIGGRWRERKWGHFQKGCVQKHISPRTARFISGIRERGAMPDCFRIHKTPHHDSLSCIRPRGERPGFFRIHSIPPQVFGRVSGRGEHARLLQDTQSCLLATSVHIKPTFTSPPVGHAPDCGPPRELLLHAALRPRSHRPRSQSEQDIFQNVDDLTKKYPVFTNT